MTVPLGVLKAGSIAFEPALPDAVAGPVSRLGMGVFNKVFVQFPERFWNEGTYVIRALGEAGEHWHSWYDVSAVSGIPTLLTFAAGPFGRRMQELPDAEIVADAVSALRVLYPDAVGEPLAHWVTRWGEDEFSNGSYSHLAVGSTHHDHDALAGPVDGGTALRRRGDLGRRTGNGRCGVLLRAPGRGAHPRPLRRPHGLRGPHHRAGADGSALIAPISRNRLPTCR